MDVKTFFDILAQQLVVNPPPVPQDCVALRKVHVAEEALQDPGNVSMLANIPDLAEARMQADFAASSTHANNWDITNFNDGAFGTDYDLRAGTARDAIGAALAVDAVYGLTAVDGSGNPLNSSNNYTIHFAPGLTPPVNNFWSVTMYGEAGFLVQNPANVYNIGSQQPIQFNADGSLDLFLQSTAPASGTSNWLPAPDPSYVDTLADGTLGTPGSFNLVLRLYGPSTTDPSIFDGTWQPPSIVKH
jgi:hypothetical protein